MDPNQTLIDLLEQLADGNGSGAVGACEDLAEWLDKGGAVPQAAARRALLARKVCESLHEYAHNFYEDIPEDLATIVTEARAALGAPEHSAYDDACEGRSHGEATCPHCREELPRRSDPDAETSPTQIRCQCCGAWVDSPPEATATPEPEVAPLQCPECGEQHGLREGGGACVECPRCGTSFTAYQID